MVGSWSLPIVMFINILNIAGRYFIKVPVKPTYELTGLFMVMLLALGWPYTSAIRGHVFVDVLTMRLPKSIQIGLEILNSWIAFIFFMAMAWSSVETAKQFYKLGSHSDLLEIPYLYLAVLMAFGAFLVCIVILLQFFQLLKIKNKG